MIFAKTVQIEDAVNDRLKRITKANGCRYDAHVNDVDDAFKPQQDVEITLEPVGFRPTGEAALEHTELDLLFQVNVLIARRLATETERISRVAMQVVAEVERELFTDPQLGGLALSMEIEEASRTDHSEASHYEWILLIAVTVQYPFSNAIQ